MHTSIIGKSLLIHEVERSEMKGFEKIQLSKFHCFCALGFRNLSDLKLKLIVGFVKKINRV